MRIGLAAMAVPLSRAELEYAEKTFQDAWYEPVGRENIPPPTPDYTPFATKLKEANPNWMYSYAPWVTQITDARGDAPARLAGRLHRLGASRGRSRLVRVKDPKFYVIGANALFQDGLPVHQEIRTPPKSGRSIRRSR